MSYMGFIEIKHIIHCKCGRSETLPRSMMPRYRLIESIGWKSDNTYGYLCPDCAPKEEALPVYPNIKRLLMLEELYQVVKDSMLETDLTGKKTLKQSGKTIKITEPILKVLKKLENVQ